MHEATERSGPKYVGLDKTMCDHLNWLPTQYVNFARITADLDHYNRTRFFNSLKTLFACMYLQPLAYVAGFDSMRVVRGQQFVVDPLNTTAIVGAWPSINCYISAEIGSGQSLTFYKVMYRQWTVAHLLQGHVSVVDSRSPSTRSCIK